MKYFIIAGERSGDLHASALVKHLRQIDSEGQFVGYGGEEMEAVGVSILSHYKEGAYMGLWEVVRHFPSIIKRLNKCKEQIRSTKPDVLILVDYPGFNLRMADYAKSLGIKTVYYISPKVWAWGSKRIKQIKRCVDRMLVTFPFEEEYYADRGYEVSYVGNSTKEQIQNHKQQKLNLPLGYEKVVAILPGSRLQEVKSSLGILKEVVESLPQFLFLIATVDNLDESVYEKLTGLLNVIIVKEQAFDVVKSADAAIVTSGTATLETSLIGTPQVVCYRTSWLTYLVGRLLLKIPYISLVNLLANRQVVTELIQHRFNAKQITKDLNKLLFNSRKRQDIKKGYLEVSQLLGDHSASRNAAKSIYDLIA